MSARATASGARSPICRPMATITHDTLDWYGFDADGAGVHDVIGTRCDPYTNRLINGVDYHHCCHSNLTRALAARLKLPFAEAEPHVHDVLNVFMCTGFTRDEHRYFMKASPVRPGDFIEFFAEIDLIGALSTCPGGDCGAGHFERRGALPSAQGGDFSPARRGAERLAVAGGQRLCGRGRRVGICLQRVGLTYAFRARTAPAKPPPRRRGRGRRGRRRSRGRSLSSRGDRRREPCRAPRARLPTARVLPTARLGRAADVARFARVTICVGMLGAERLLVDRQRALEERPRAGEVALGLKQEGEVVEARRRLGMLGAERLLADRQRALEERPRAARSPWA